VCVCVWMAVLTALGRNIGESGKRKKKNSYIILIYIFFYPESVDNYNAHLHTYVGLIRNHTLFVIILGFVDGEGSMECGERILYS